MLSAERLAALGSEAKLETVPDFGAVDYRTQRPLPTASDPSSQICRLEEGSSPLSVFPPGGKTGGGALEAGCPHVQDTSAPAG